jgi:hypothetical protein
VQVPHDEGLATRIGPEPCAAIREGVGEASAGEHTGQPSSREKFEQPGCRRVSNHGRPHGRTRYRECLPDPAWSETLACVEALCSGTGRSRAWPADGHAGPHRKGEKP